MNWATIMCWTLLLLAAFFCENVTSKGGRGGARGAARGRGRSSSSNSRMRMKPAPRYSSSGSAFRVAAAASAGAAAGAAAGAIAGVAGRRISGEVGPNDGLEMDFYYGNQTREGVYSYRYQQHKTQELEEFQFLSIYSSAISQLCSKVFVPNHVSPPKGRKN